MHGAENATQDSPSSSRMRSTDRLTQIIEVSTRIIGQYGHYGFSIQQVADACGLTKAGLLHHVKSKDRLLMLVLQARDEADMTLIGALEESTPAPDGAGSEEALRRALDLIHRLVAHNASQPQIVRLYSVLRNESLATDHPTYEYFVARDRMALDEFERIFAPFVDSPGSFARRVLALMGGLEEQWLRDPSMDLVEEWDLAISSLLDGSRRR